MNALLFLLLVLIALCSIPVTYLLTADRADEQLVEVGDAPDPVLDHPDFAQWENDLLAGGR